MSGERNTSMFSMPALNLVGHEEEDGGALSDTQTSQESFPNHRAFPRRVMTSLWMRPASHAPFSAHGLSGACVNDWRSLTRQVISPTRSIRGPSHLSGLEHQLPLGCTTFPLRPSQVWPSMSSTSRLMPHSTVYGPS